MLEADLPSFPSRNVEFWLPEIELELFDDSGFSLHRWQLQTTALDFDLSKPGDID